MIKHDAEKGGFVYSQNGEDEIVLQECLPADFTGVILDIGAGPPVKYSNSRAFIERGWKAVLVEPSAFFFSELAAEYGGNPSVTLVHAAVAPSPGLMVFHERRDDPMYSKIGGTHKAATAYWVRATTVGELVDNLGFGADVLSIDCEGMSFDILTTCPVEQWGTRVIIVEHDNRIVEICGWARVRGYRACEVNAENLILLKRSGNAVPRP